MVKALKAVNTNSTVQTEKAKPNQVKNNAGGFVFSVSNKDRLERFLILGTDGGTYYVQEKKLTDQNVDFVRNMLKSDANNVLKTTIDISDNGRAKSNSPALFTLALAMNTDGVNRNAVKEALRKVARTSTHLFEYGQYLKNLGGWGRAKRESVNEWYAAKNTSQLAYQVVKYRQRDGWTHRDMMRLTHPQGLDSDVVNFALGKAHNSTEKIIVGFEKAQRAKDAKEIIALIHEYNITWEMIPTQFHKDLSVWKAFFEADVLGHTTLLRNVTRFARLEAFRDVKFAAEFANRLADSDRIAKSRIHPISFLNASVIFEEGSVDRKSSGYDWGSYVSRKKNWETNSKVATALNDAFYESFKNVEPANKSTLVAVDTSASMTWYAAQGADLSAMQVAAAVGMMIARTEPYSEMRGFSTRMVEIGITENDSLTTAMNKIHRAGGGGTDLAQPMIWAKNNKLEFETFVSITDNETWFGNVHPFQALKNYRQSTGLDARMAVLAVVPTEFTIADPSDRGMMDFVGFDSNVPRMLADFSAGRI